MCRVSESVRSTHGQNGAIVLDIRQGQIFTVNLVGSRILQLLENGATKSLMVDEISRGFRLNRNQVEHDLEEFLDSLKAHQLVE